MTSTEELKTFSTNFYPNREDIMIAYAVVNFFKGEYSQPAFSNLDLSFINVCKVLEKQYIKLRP